MRFLVGFFALILLAAAALAEQMYVDDKLVLNVYAEPDQGSRRIATIRTGDVVDALERRDRFMRVQLADGRAGWVGANYLSARPPAILVLKDLERSSDVAAEPFKRLRDEIARLSKRNAALQRELAQKQKELEEKNLAVASVPADDVSAAAAPPVHGGADTAALTAQPATVERSNGWVWLLAVVAAGGAGFFSGYQALARRVRARFGGVKVY